VIPRSKLNRCEHCSSQKNLSIVFSSNGRMYFICQSHKLLLDALIAEAAKAGISL